MSAWWLLLICPAYSAAGEHKQHPTGDRKHPAAFPFFLNRKDVTE